MHSDSGHPAPAPPAALAARWRADAAVLRRYGARGRAAMLERLAAELEAHAEEEDGATVELAAACDLSGYTRGHLRRLMREGRLPFLGSEEAPAFRACDLPRKPGYVSAIGTLAQPVTPVLSSRVQVARAVVSGD